MDDRLDVVRLRKHVEGADGFDLVAGFAEGAEVARECGRVAGDVGDEARAEVDDAADDFRVGTGAGRVEEDEVNAFEAMSVPREPVADGRSFNSRVRESRGGEVAARVFGGRSVPFDCDDAREAPREREREESDAAVEVERRRPDNFVAYRLAARRVAQAFGFAQAFGDERVEERVVDLEEAARVEAVALAADGARLFARVLFFDGRVERDAEVARDGLELVRAFGQ